ncbi:MAG TPA: hypothetical protein VEQ66_17285, partial [Propionibacteriaceae bacterium]|nr:hypothetical protein [Propionibacteriaceae bacterium]
WARFGARRAEAGPRPEQINRIPCPIGHPEVTGKEPAVIAIGVAAALVQTLAAHAPSGRLSTFGAAP